jgi:hypothetical protein
MHIPRCSSPAARLPYLQGTELVDWRPRVLFDILSDALVRHREADRRHEKIFSTIARDLADRDPGMKRALADAVKNANSLKNTTDIIQQWRKLLMEPLKKFPASSVLRACLSRH